MYIRRVSPDQQPAGSPADDAAPGPTDEIAGLDQIAADLAAVEAALERIEAATYWTDELTGAPLPDDLLAADPTARTTLTPPPESSDAEPSDASAVDADPTDAESSDAEAIGDASAVDDEQPG